MLSFNSSRRMSLISLGREAAPHTMQMKHDTEAVRQHCIICLNEENIFSAIVLERKSYAQMEGAGVVLEHISWVDE